MVLGIDPGMDHLAWALIDDEAHYLWGTVTFGPKHGSDGQRIDLYAAALKELLLRFSPSLVAIEHQFTRFTDDDHKRRDAMARAAMRLAELRAVLLRVCRECGVRTAEIAPATVKKLVAGHGRAEKWRVEEAVRLTHGINERLTADEADAIAIADAAIIRESGEAPKTKPWTGELIGLGVPANTTTGG